MQEVEVTGYSVHHYNARPGVENIMRVEVWCVLGFIHIDKTVAQKLAQA